MSDPKVYSWPVASATSVAALQTYVAAATLLLNGTINGGVANNYVKFNGISRKVTLTSANDLHLINVTVTGTLNGAVQSEVMAGPNVNTVASTKYYDSITSITTSGAVTAMSVGTGTEGFTNWFTFDTHGSVANLAIQCVATATISYSFQVTLDDVQTVASPTTFTPVTTLTTATGSILANYTAPFAYGRIAILSSDATGSLTASFLQQGLHS